MTNTDKNKIAAFSEKITGELNINLRTSDDKRSESFESFCSILSELVPNIKVKKEKSESLPAIVVGSSLIYHCIPEGIKLDPFLEALLKSHGNDNGLSELSNVKLNKISLPATLEVYIGPHCPYCPAVLKSILPMLRLKELISITVIDGFFFQELSENRKIRSVPTIYLDDNFRWSGNVALDDVLDVLIEMDPSKLQSSAIERMLSEGNAHKVAELMTSRELIFDSYIELLFHEKWPVRLGAMVAAEELADAAEELASQLPEKIWARFEDSDDTLKPDLIHVVGETGTSYDIDTLRSYVSKEPDSELSEAAVEAIDKICEREGGMI